MTSERPEAEVLLSELTWSDVRSTKFETAVLPWGATEAHNLHLPYTTDNIQVEWIAAEAARRAVRDGASVVVLPGVPFGVNTQQLDIPLTVNMNPSTQAAVLGDVVQSLERGSVRKLVVLNGHGGNDFRQMVRELQSKTSLFLCVVDWFRVVPWSDYFEASGDHAGEMETSVMLHVAGDLVRPLESAGSGSARAFRLSGFRDGTAWAPRRWTSVTDDTGVGDPSRASAAKGEAFLKAVVDRIAEFLVELSRSDPDDMYEYVQGERS